MKIHHITVKYEYSVMAASKSDAIGFALAAIDRNLIRPKIKSTYKKRK